MFQCSKNLEDFIIFLHMFWPYFDFIVLDLSTKYVVSNSAREYPSMHYELKNHQKFG